MASVLLVYHFLVWTSIDSKLFLSTSLVLYGLFLLWQPLWSKSNKINQFRVLTPLTILATLAVLAFFFPKESLIFYGLLFSGMIGSRLLGQSSFRSFDLFALLIIILEISIGVVPESFPEITTPNSLADNIQTLVLILILLLFFAPNLSRKRQNRSQVDLVHGLLTSTLISIVLLGGIVINLLYGVDYIDGLLLTVFIVSTMTIGVSWFWNPGVGYSGIGDLWNRYTMTIGGPFEIWISTLTALIEEQYLTPARFLEAACEHLVENDWLSGIQWRFESNKIIAGKVAGFYTEYTLAEGVEVKIFYKSAPGNALEQHTMLLARMAYQFYLAKLNQEKIRVQEHFATIHHTGARLTHDIKNILQSTKTSLEILNTNDDPKSHQALLQANLTQINNRLENTLSKLKTPTLNTKLNLINIKGWMAHFKTQHQTSSKLTFHSDIEVDNTIPVDMFDSIADNLLGNALRKPSAKRIDVRLLSTRELILLSICDDGDSIQQDIENDLFRQPVSSGSGMGIGLYQSAIMASTYHFELELSQNEDGRVCFNLYQHLAD